MLFSTSNKKLPVALGIATRNKKLLPVERHYYHYYKCNKKLLSIRSPFSLFHRSRHRKGLNTSRHIHRSLGSRRMLGWSGLFVSEQGLHSFLKPPTSETCEVGC